VDVKSLNDADLQRFLDLELSKFGDARPYWWARLQDGKKLRHRETRINFMNKVFGEVRSLAAAAEQTSIYI